MAAEVETAPRELTEEEKFDAEVKAIQDEVDAAFAEAEAERAAAAAEAEAKRRAEAAAAIEALAGRLAFLRPVADGDEIPADDVVFVTSAAAQYAEGRRLGLPAGAEAFALPASVAAAGSGFARGMVANFGAELGPLPVELDAGALWRLLRCAALASVAGAPEVPDLADPAVVVAPLPPVWYAMADETLAARPGGEPVGAWVARLVKAADAYQFDDAAEFLTRVFGERILGADDATDETILRDCGLPPFTLDSLRELHAQWPHLGEFNPADYRLNPDGTPMPDSDDD